MPRSLQIVIPFKPDEAKSRLAEVLAPEERKRLAYSMLRDVLNVSLGHGHATILSRPGLDPARVGKSVEILESDLELNEALNYFLEEHARQGCH